MGKLTLLILVSALAADAQAPTGFEQNVRSAMQQSIEKQRASVQKQAVSAMPVANLPDSGFFTAPWPKPASFMPQIQAPCDPMPKDKLDPLVKGAAQNEGVDPQLVQAVIDQESASKPCAVSVKGAQGLMQLMPATAAELGVKDAFDAQQNVEAGTRFLKQLLTKYNGDVSLALSAYNAGSGRVDHDGGIPEIPETINYVKDILAKVPAQQ